MIVLKIIGIMFCCMLVFGTAGHFFCFFHFVFLF